MLTTCTIVMYHYVRDLKHSRYPEIKGLDTTLFKEQILFLRKNYHLVTVEDIAGAIDAGAALPPNAALLTFDDAYIDHYTNVFPILDAAKVQGSFYVPVRTVKEHTVLDVNKIHFILAAVADKQQLIAEIYSLLDAYRSEYGLQPNDYYFSKLAVASRFDTAEVIFIKRLLQVELPEALRNLMTNTLFMKFVTNDEQGFSQELYMDMEQISCMQRHGMHIGGHGNNHYWLASLSREKQEEEIVKSLDFIKEIGGNANCWTMSYPYGSYNQDSLELLQAHNCSLAFTTKVDKADIARDTRLELPRLDTNDLPKDRNAPFKAE